MSERNTVAEFWHWFNNDITIDEAFYVQQMVMAAVGEQLVSGRDVALGSILARVQADAMESIAQRKEQRLLDSFDDDYDTN